MLEGNHIQQEIIRQLGGENRITAMTGAAVFTWSENAVCLTFLRGKIRAVVVTYEKRSDLYKVEFFNKKSKLLASEDAIFAHDLKSRIEENTGLYLSLNEKKY